MSAASARCRLSSIDRRSAGLAHRVVIYSLSANRSPARNAISPQKTTNSSTDGGTADRPTDSPDRRCFPLIFGGHLNRSLSLRRSAMRFDWVFICAFPLIADYAEKRYIMHEFVVCVAARGAAAGDRGAAWRMLGGTTLVYTWRLELASVSREVGDSEEGVGEWGWWKHKLKINPVKMTSCGALKVSQTPRS